MDIIFLFKYLTLDAKANYYDVINIQLNNDNTNLK